MYFKQRNNVIFRDFGKFGYLTDNRNFGYRQKNDVRKDIGDKIVSQTGAIFLSALGRMPQELNCLVGKISEQFLDIDMMLLKADVREFYQNLVADGFLASGPTIQDCNNADKQVAVEGISETESSDAVQDTQDFFDGYFKDELQLTHVHIELTSKCNERCIHCYIPHENKICSMKTEMLYNILDQCRDLNVLHLTISGGEPMLHREFIPFLRKCNEYNFSVNVLSNLTLLTEEIIIEMKKNPLLGVQVSLYAIDNVIHDSITNVSGSCERTKRAILKLVDNGISIQISCPIMKQNLNCYKDVLEWGNMHNINVVSDYVLIARYNHTRQNLHSRLTIDDVKGIILQKSANNPHYLMEVRKKAKEKHNLKPDDFICSVCHSSICISEQGKVYPCAGWQDYVVGDINKEALKDIWQNAPKVQYLRKLRRKDFLECLNCPNQKFCTMCMVRNANENPSGDMLVVNKYFCDIANLYRCMVCKI